MKIPASYCTEPFEKLYIEKEQERHGSRGTLHFRSVVEDHVFYDEDGNPEAVINTISYIKESERGETKERPVLFFWNGGPGSATSTLQLECFGPWQMKFDGREQPTSELTEEEECLLDVCDLVFVDPVGVGFSRLLQESAADRYWSLEGDARSNAFAVTDWIKTHSRWNSRIFLCGESYGTVRVCRILEELGRNPMKGNRMMLGIQISGVILIGLALSLNAKGSIIDEKLDLLTAALPSMAAVYWYQNLQGACELRTFVEKAWRFAGEELQPALFLGDACSEEQVKAIAGRLEHFTGMKASYFEQTGLKLGKIEDFMVQVAAGKGLRVDLYDGRKTQSLSSSYNVVGNGNVPIRIMNGSLAKKLGVNGNRLYYTGNINVNDTWSMKTSDGMSPMECLTSAMERMPDMQVLTASGLYDLCTLVGNTRYLFSHSGVKGKRLVNREYAGGHGVYSTKEGKAEFLLDVRTMIENE